MLIRPRRNRKSAGVRSLVQETTLTPQDFIYPLFVHAGTENSPIDSMPGCLRWSEEGIVGEAKEAFELGIPAVVLFPAVEESKKTPLAEESYNPEGLVPRVIRRLKKELPELVVITDVALDPYNSDGHDGLVETNERGEAVILNDETVEILCKQALSHAEAGADIVSPSDMMDGRVEALREALDSEGYQEVSILSYSVKYASAYYGPFRGALNSAPKAGDKKTYQMDFHNVTEAIRETQLDEQEGADMIMVKPAGAYLDVIKTVSETTALPIAAYQVSGEYLMIKAAAAGGWVDEDKIAYESLVAIKRAGAQMILTYFAKQMACLLSK